MVFHSNGPLTPSPRGNSPERQEASGVEPVDAESSRGGQRILFMDDEEILREMVAAMLDYMGYEASSVGDGAAAIEEYQLAQAAGRPYSVVIVDLTVPGGMGGYEAVQKLRVIDPAVKAVVSSGYSSDPLVLDYQKHGFSGVIAKPYQLSELEAMLHALIGPPPPKD